MDRIWAPWRIDFILSAERPDGCILCDLPAEGPERRRGNLILAVRDRAFVMMNRYPYTNGHLMVVPRAHVASLDALSATDHAALWDLVREATAALARALRPGGINLGMNLGRCAGAGIADHLHVHLVPRWEGDTNFMPVVADLRVMPEHLDATYERLRPAFEPLGTPPSPGGSAPR
jgi:ATP adenylyltransferase